MQHENAKRMTDGQRSADLLTETCRKVDPQSTNEALIQPGSESDDLIGLGRRNA
jgi:hypothetical protein